MQTLEPVSTVTTDYTLYVRKLKGLLHAMPRPFTLRDMSTGLAQCTPPAIAGKEPRLAEAVITDWLDRGVIQRAGLRDGLPAYRRKR